MRAFSPTDVALEGFRITRENPRAILAWAILSFLVSLVLAPLMISMAGPELMQLEQSAADQLSTEEAAALMAKVMPLYLVLIPMGLTLQSVMAGAVFRAVLRPSERGLGFLKLGGDEGRLILLTISYVLLSMAAAFVATLALGIVAGILAAVAGANIGALAVVVMIAVMFLLVFAGVRLSLCAPQTFAERKVRPFDSWKLTRGRFWPLFGAYAMAAALCVVVVLLANVVFAGVAVALTGGNLAAVGKLYNPDFSSVAAYFTPMSILYILFNALLTPVTYAAVVAPPAAAYRQLTREAADA